MSAVHQQDYAGAACAATLVRRFQDRPRCAPLPAISMTGALVLPDVMVGIAEASATHRPATRYTRAVGVETRWRSTGSTVRVEGPIAQVPTGWKIVVRVRRPPSAGLRRSPIEGRAAIPPGGSGPVVPRPMICRVIRSPRTAMRRRRRSTGNCNKISGLVRSASAIRMAARGGAQVADGGRDRAVWVQGVAELRQGQRLNVPLHIGTGQRGSLFESP